jgi:hypothetical protein
LPAPPLSLEIPVTYGVTSLTMSILVSIPTSSVVMYLPLNECTNSPFTHQEFLRFRIAHNYGFTSAYI